MKLIRRRQSGKGRLARQDRRVHKGDQDQWVPTVHREIKAHRGRVIQALLALLAHRDIKVLLAFPAHLDPLAAVAVAVQVHRVHRDRRAIRGPLVQRGHKDLPAQMAQLDHPVQQDRPVLIARCQDLLAHRDLLVLRDPV